MSYSHGDLQIKRIYPASKCETSDVISDVIIFDDVA